MAIRYTPAGIQISRVPTAGISDASAVAMPKNIGSGTPLIQYPMAASKPCANPVTTVPATVWRPTRRNSFNSARVCSGCSGETLTVALTMRDQWSSTRCIARTAKKRPSRAANVPDARAVAMRADCEAISPAPASSRSLRLEVEIPRCASHPLTASTRPPRAPPGRSPSRTDEATPTARMTNTETNAANAPPTAAPDASTVVREARNGLRVRRASAA